ncbi:hypothetical protein VNO78_17408 [Psophocarpus tetragonolobus]|uniref:Cytochrome P450 n=1 Tax=Psophocarpus tetragonolobus TaxID=3891 RepID=A0AAN9SJF6_PSOTE
MILMLVQQLLSFFLFIILPLFVFVFRRKPVIMNSKEITPSHNISLPKSYPFIGSYLAVKANENNHVQWLSDIIKVSPAATVVLHGPLGLRQVITGNPAIVEHILKTRFSNYQKGYTFIHTLSDLLGKGIFNTNGDKWKFQRQVASHEFNKKSLRRFVEQVADAELSNRLIPILASTALQDQTLNLQNILQRFAFDNVCQIAFGFDPEYLTSSVERSRFVQAFEEATGISSKRFFEPLPLVWETKRILNVGSEKRLRVAVREVQKFAKKIVREKKKELREKATLESGDMLSWFLSSGHTDEDFVMDIVISFIMVRDYLG